MEHDCRTGFYSNDKSLRGTGHHGSLPARVRYLYLYLLPKMIFFRCYVGCVRAGPGAESSSHEHFLGGCLRAQDVDAAGEAIKGFGFGGVAA